MKREVVNVTHLVIPAELGTLLQAAGGLYALWMDRLSSSTQSVRQCLVIYDLILPLFSLSARRELHSDCLALLQAPHIRESSSGQLTLPLDINNYPFDRYVLRYFRVRSVNIIFKLASILQILQCPFGMPPTPPCQCILVVGAQVWDVEDTPRGPSNLHRRGPESRSTAAFQHGQWNHDIVCMSNVTKHPQIVCHKLCIMIIFFLHLCILLQVLRFMGDPHLNGAQENMFGNYIIQRGLSSPGLRDEILSQVVNQVWRNVNADNAERGWLLLLACVCSFAPSPQMDKYLLK